MAACYRRLPEARLRDFLAELDSRDQAADCPTRAPAIPKVLPRRSAGETQPVTRGGESTVSGVKTRSPPSSPRMAAFAFGTSRFTKRRRSIRWCQIGHGRIVRGACADSFSNRARSRSAVGRATSGSTAANRSRIAAKDDTPDSIASGAILSQRSRSPAARSEARAAPRCATWTWAAGATLACRWADSS